MSQSFGIEDIRFAFPSLYMDLSDLAIARSIEPAKLQKGLGLYEMGVCDTEEDVVTLAADALIDIVKSNNLTPREIGRIYVGTESSIDGSKPIASYLLGILTQYFTEKGQLENCLRHVDVVDMTFACIGAIDAMHNSLAWLRTEPELKAIVIATDIANYDLASSGEYTQGAGASAVLLGANPALMTISSQVGVASACAHDFFKPLRLHSKSDVDIKGIHSYEEDIVSIHRETPVFDGPLSNKTYQDRIVEAYHYFVEKSKVEADINQYDAFVFHLPYAYHGRRIFDQLFLADLNSKGSLESFYAGLNVNRPDKSTMDADTFKQAKRAFSKAIVKSPEYSSIVENKIERGERLSSKTGNVYTASIFLALLSTLEHHAADNQALNKLLFIAYGSGSKSKVFEGVLSDNWKNKVSTWKLDSQLRNRTRIDFDTYVNLRLHKITDNVSPRKPQVHLDNSGILETNRYAREYRLNKV